MSLQQIKRDLEEIREAVKPKEHHEETVIIYDPAKGIPKFADSKIRIFIPDNGRDPGISQLC